MGWMYPFLGHMIISRVNGLGCKVALEWAKSELMSNCLKHVLILFIVGL